MRTPSDLPRRPTREFRNPLTGRGRIALVIIVAAIIVVFISAKSVSNFAVDVWWFDSLGRGDVFWGVLRTKLLLALVFTVAFIAIAIVSLAIADRLAPLVHSDGPEDQIFDRYHEVIGTRQPIVRAVFAVLFGLIVGLPTSGHWQEWLMFRNSKGFGIADPEFGRDVGFYMFKLPFLMFVVDWLFASLFLITLLTAVAHYVNGGIRLQPGARHVTAQVKLHLSVLLAAMALLKAVDYWLQRFELTTSARGTVDGLSYTEKNAQLPATNLLIVISLLAAILLIYNVRQKGIALPVISVGLWLIVAVVAGTIYPAIVQRVSVQPSELTKEHDTIIHNIEATNHAIGLDKVKTVPITQGHIASTDVDNTKSISSFKNVRLIDPTIFQKTFQSKQGQRAYYQFTNVDTDRYTLDGREQQVTLSARELNPSNIPSGSWVGQHLSYTSGYGLAFAPSSQVTVDGAPDYVDVTTPTNTLNLKRPEIYVGDQLSGYSVVGTGNAEQSLDPSQPNYTGTDGVKLDSTLRKLAFAVSFGEYNMFGSKLISESSKVIYNRDVKTRISKVAPFLKLDADPYPVVYDGRLVWIEDAYTTSGRYPNAQFADNRQLPDGSGLGGSYNYVRNSVKAVVDAYNGTVTLYVVDDTDPIIKVWESAFPKLFTPGADIPAELRSHFRYPEDLFRVQTNMYGRYQLNDPTAFYNQANAWSVAQEPDTIHNQASVAADTSANTVAAGSGRVQDSNKAKFEPYYTMFQAPDASTSEFVLFRPYVPFSADGARQELQGFMTASSDPSDYGTLIAYSVNGTLPDGKKTSGPTQVHANIETTFSKTLSLLGQGGTQVEFGDTQLIPLKADGSGLIWVRPWFLVNTSGDTQVASLVAVSVTSGDNSTCGASIGDAIDSLFPGVRVVIGDRPAQNATSGTSNSCNSSDTSAGTAAGTGTGTGTGTGSSPSTTTPSAGPGTGTATPEQLLTQAQAAYNAAQVALKAGDLGTYQTKLNEAYTKAAQAASVATGTTVTANTKAGSTTSSTPSSSSSSNTSPSGTTPTTGA